MKKTFVTILALSLLLILFGCSNKSSSTGSGDAASEPVKIVVAATLDPHSRILEYVKPILAEQGYDLEIRVLDDYYVFNKLLDDGEIDANYFQHIPFFNGEVEANGYEITNVAGVHIEPFGFYSKTISSVEELSDGATIIISNNVAEYGRVLSILDKAGVITLKDDFDVFNATLNDIAENPKNLVFTEVKPELLTTAYDNDEGELIAINGNYALQAGLNPTKDAVILEQADATNPYVNVLTVRIGTENDPKIVALANALKSDAVKQFILDTYADGSVIPAQ
ncbi:MAG: methionine ABC transporter substrate-binding protein [Erysipelotrichaceae bacterium]|jgi:D-methionine transport system substrate-binding protein|nr:methionine ABC transporter substrate-binding protein [Erysipelotrichaceae bacterium]